MRRTRQRPMRLAAAAATAASLALAAGCGGGGSDSSSPSTAGRAQEQAQGAVAAGTPTTPTTPAPATPHPPPIETVRRELASFRDCLRRHGAEPLPLRSGPDAGETWQELQRSWAQRSPDQARAQIRARIACIPELPPRLRASAEQLKRRYERRNG